MSGELYLCAYAAEFPVQALLRLRPELPREPVAVLEGRPPQQCVCSMNRSARECGAALGMTRLDAEAIAGLRLVARSVETEAAARAVFLECAAQFSPRMEEVSEETACSFVLDIAGTERLFGPPQQLAERLRASLAATGFRASLAVSRNFHVARMMAAAGTGIAVVAAAEEAIAVEKLPVSALSLSAQQEETLALWGIRTLGELAGLPVAELVTRMGAVASRFHALARGAAEHAFQPMEPAFVLEEFCEFEDPVEQLDSLLFVAGRMIECLAARARSRALLLATLTARMKLDSGAVHEVAIRPALPTSDRKFLLKLLQLEIGMHPPGAAVAALTLHAEAGQASAVQMGLFAPQTPEPSRLDVTLARLKALVGEERVGAPALEDSHRGGNFRMEHFAGSKSTSQQVSEPAGQRVALRRVRPAAPIHVILRANRPAVFRERGNRFDIAAAYGPWRTSGCWWAEDAWDTEEWDVLAIRADGAAVACVLSCARPGNVWRLEAFYD